MESVLVVTRRDRLGDLALHLDAQMIGKHQVLAGPAPCFTQSESRRKRGDRGCTSNPYTRSAAADSCVSS